MSVHTIIELTISKIKSNIELVDSISRNKPGVL